MNIGSEEKIQRPLKNGNMSAYPTITPPGTLDAALSPLLELSASDFEQLVQATATPRSFSLNSTGISQLKSRLPSVSNNLPYLLGGLSFLYAQIDGLGDVGDGFETVI